MMVSWWVDGKENVKSKKDEMNRRKVKNIGERKERKRGREKENEQISSPPILLFGSQCV